MILVRKVRGALEVWVEELLILAKPFVEDLAASRCKDRILSSLALGITACTILLRSSAVSMGVKHNCAQYSILSARSALQHSTTACSYHPSVMPS